MSKTSFFIVITVSLEMLYGMPLAHGATLVDDQFVDGGRTNGADALDVAWFTWQPTSETLSNATDTTTGPNEGSADNALNIAVGAQGFRGITGILPSAFTLASAGDSITLRYDMLFTGSPSTNAAGVRFGLYNSQGTAAADGGVNQADDKGYLGRLSIGTGTATIEGWRETGGNGATTSGTDTVLIAGGSGSGVANANTTYVRLSLSITRNALSGLDLVFMEGVNTTTLSTIWSVTEASGSVATYSFDEIALGTGTNTTDFRIDNVLVTTIPEPSTWAMLASGLVALVLLRRRSRSSRQSVFPS